MQSEIFKRAKRVLPGLQWLEGYSRRTFGEDALASLITAILLIPQSLAYALLAGLPAQAGLYASIAPLVAYALFGSSRVLAVGPVAVVSLMTAAAIGNLGLTDPAQQMAAAGALAALSSFFLLLFGLFKLGSVSNFLSRPVVGAFVTASTILIIASQAKHILGINSHGSTLPEILLSMSPQLGAINLVALVIGVGSIAFLVAARTILPRLLTALKLSEDMAGGIARAAPAGLVVLATAIAWSLHLDSGAALAVVGALPSGLPPIQLPIVSLDIWRALIGPAALISLSVLSKASRSASRSRQDGAKVSIRTGNSSASAPPMPPLP